jgi:hypothetical protein
MRTRTLLLVAAAACSTRGPDAAVATAPNYELACAAASTATAAQMQCVRTDTRSGEVLVVDYMKLPVSSGPTAVGAASPGRFTTACAAPATTTRADFLCIRMNTETGEMILVNLTKIGSLPPKS